MQDRLSAYDEKVLRRLIQLETARRQERKQGPLAFVKRDTEAGSAMRRLDQMGMIGAMYKDNNPYVVEVLAKGYSYLRHSGRRTGRGPSHRASPKRRPSS